MHQMKSITNDDRTGCEAADSGMGGARTRSLEPISERSGVPAGEAEPWRLEVQRLVRLGPTAANRAAYFPPDGRSACASEIYSIAGE